MIITFATSLQYERDDNYAVWLFCCLGEPEKVVALITSCSKSISEQLRREHLGLKTILCQEWRLFLLERLFHNAAAMHRKNNSSTCKGAPTPQQIDVAKEMAAEHP